VKFGSETIEKAMVIGDRTIENVTRFVYLGSLLTWHYNCTEDITVRIGKLKE